MLSVAHVIGHDHRVPAPAWIAFVLLKDEFQKAREGLDRWLIIYQAACIFKSQYVGVGAVYGQKQNPSALESASPFNILFTAKHAQTHCAYQPGGLTTFVLLCVALQLGFLKGGLEGASLAQ